MTEKVPEIYSDGCANVHWLHNMVKLDFVTHIQTEPNQPPKAENVVRIVMTPNAMLELAKSLDDLIQKLIDAGIAQKRK